jgi:sec-independent protein translocase protein TatC
MSNGQLRDAEDDYFRETRMGFGDHIEELREHLWRAIRWFLLAMFLSLFVGKAVLNWITYPVKQQLDRFYDRAMQRTLQEKNAREGRLVEASPYRKVWFLRDQLQAVAKGVVPNPARPILVTQDEVAKEETAKQTPTWWTWLYDLGVWLAYGSPQNERAARLGDHVGPVREIRPEDKEKEFVAVWMSVDNPLFSSADMTLSIREILQIDSPTTLRAEEAFFVWFKVCMVTGFVLGSPLIFREIWLFIAAGLYPHEKKLVHFYLPISVGLFLFGVAICEFFVIPKALEALLWFNEWLGFKPDIRLNDWLGFAIFMPLVFGLSFQTPLVMMLLNRLGIVNADTFRDKRSYAWFAMAIFAAICTPSTDAFSMLFLWVPMSLLFELGILMMAFTPQRPEDQEEKSEYGDLIEV